MHSQTELLALLEAEGIEVTQATLSRDLDELGAVKLRGADGGAPVYVIPDDGSPVRGIEGGTARLARLLGELLVSADASRQPGRAAHPAGCRAVTWPARWTGPPCTTSSAPSPATTRCLVVAREPRTGAELADRFDRTRCENQNGARARK